MKKLILMCAILCMFTYSAMADVFLIYDTSTKEVYSASEKNDTLIPDGNEIIKLKGTIKGLGLSKNLVYYKYLDGEFIVNNKKINDEYQAALIVQDVVKDMEAIEKKIKEQAFDALEAEGFKFKSLKKEDL